METLENYTHLNVLVSFYADNDNEVSRPAWQSAYDFESSESMVQDERQIWYSNTYMQSLKETTYELIHKTETDTQREQSYGYQGERVGEREG